MRPMPPVDHQKSPSASRTRPWKWALAILAMETGGLAFLVLLSILDPKPETIAVIVGATIVLLGAVGIFSSRMESRGSKK
jgi:NADPH-dependent curcumin reductase CurA